MSWFLWRRVREAIAIIRDEDGMHVGAVCIPMHECMFESECMHMTSAYVYILGT